MVTVNDRLFDLSPATQEVRRDQAYMPRMREELLDMPLAGSRMRE